MLVVKLAGTILVVFSSAFIGFFKGYSLASRCKKLSLLLDGVNTLYKNIQQGGDTLLVAMKESFRNCEFLRCEQGKVLCLDADLKRDKHLIEEFFLGLGASTKKIECDRINNFKIKLESHIKDAKNDSQQKGKLYGTLGVCIGLVIAILLF